MTCDFVYTDVSLDILSCKDDKLLLDILDVKIYVFPFLIHHIIIESE